MVRKIIRGNKTGWFGTIKPRGSLYPRYKNRKLKQGLEFRSTNTGAIFTPQGKFLGYEKNYKHISGTDRPNETGIGLIRKKKNGGK